ncbi:hypothetical protein VPHD479_0085 [Vibrio phage D479]
MSTFIVVRLKPEAIVDQIESEDELAEQSIMESLYAIRALKAAAKYGTLPIEVKLHATSDQVWIEEFQIWLQSNEYERV